MYSSLTYTHTHTQRNDVYLTFPIAAEYKLALSLTAWTLSTAACLVIVNCFFNSFHAAFQFHDFFSPVVTSRTSRVVRNPNTNIFHVLPNITFLNISYPLEMLVLPNATKAVVIDNAVEKNIPPNTNTNNN